MTLKRNTKEIANTGQLHIRKKKKNKQQTSEGQKKLFRSAERNMY